MDGVNIALALWHPLLVVINHLRGSNDGANGMPAGQSAGSTTARSGPEDVPHGWFNDG